MPPTGPGLRRLLRRRRWGGSAFRPAGPLGAGSHWVESVPYPGRCDRGRLRVYSGVVALVDREAEADRVAPPPGGTGAGTGPDWGLRRGRVSPRRRSEGAGDGPCRQAFDQQLEPPERSLPVGGRHAGAAGAVCELTARRPVRRSGLGADVITCECGIRHTRGS